jgi:FdhD protein
MTRQSNTMPDPAAATWRIAWRGDVVEDGVRVVPIETAVALTYNRTTHAVMLATPADLEDFAIGFSLSEGIIETAADIHALEIVEVPDGVECRMDLAGDRLDALTRRQRRLAGPSGCGLCGLDSLAAAVRPAPVVAGARAFTPSMIQDAMRSMHPAQTLNAATHAVHAAAFWSPEQGLVALREDVGRHNALDKLSGALTRLGVSAGSGLALLSSRVSVEMVQKAAMLGAPVIVAISAPTSLAIHVADAAGITLIGVARDDGFEVFTHPNRITTRMGRHVA